uniref:DNA-damage regulated autophagy modulator 1 n=1 Tax=Petromyzon marinus TaxID=7757 RepID=S4R608_PETMA
FWSFTEGASAMPLFVVCWTTATFGTSYLTAALRGDVDPILPYISDTAGRPPESCVFGLMLSISALAAALTMFVRYRLVAYATCGRSYAIFVNRTGFAIGLISCLGLLVVANFQQTKTLLRVSAAAEWSLGVSFLTFFLTFIRDFQ